MYRSVIDEVVTRIKPDFVQEGVDECASEPPQGPASMPVSRGLSPPAALTQVHPGRAPRSVGDKAAAEWRAERTASEVLHARCFPLQRGRNSALHPFSGWRNVDTNPFLKCHEGTCDQQLL